MNINHVIGTAAACLLLNGCANQQPMRDLADKTSANVGIVAATLRQLSDESSRLYSERATNISRLSSVNATHRANLSYDIALTKRVGEQRDLALIDELRAWVAEVDEIYSVTRNAEAERKASLLSAQTTIDSKTQALQKLAQTLSTLAKEESATERLRFLRGFAVEVRDDLKKQLDEGTESAQHAKALLNQVKASVSAPTTRD